MTEEDRNKMEVNLASFVNMTSTWEIVVKLFSRKVISEKMRQGLVRRYRLEGPNVANGTEF